MIPKIIHYCWLSTDPIPQKLEGYMKSWKKQLPDYELMLWNFDRFDINKSQWVKDAVQHKKYAFASDYIRLYAIYNYGGIYLDIDVEVIKSFDPFLHQTSMLCFEKQGDYFEMAAFGAEKHSEWVKACLTHFDQRAFVKKGSLETKILPLVINEALAPDFKTIHVKDIQEATKDSNDPYELRVLPSDFFSPKDYWTGKIEITNNTVCIHHFMGSWLPRYLKAEAWVCEYLGIKNPKLFEKINWKLRAFKLRLFK